MKIQRLIQILVNAIISIFCLYGLYECFSTWIKNHDLYWIFHHDFNNLLICILILLLFILSLLSTFLNFIIIRDNLIKYRNDLRKRLLFIVTSHILFGSVLFLFGFIILNGSFKSIIYVFRIDDPNISVWYNYWFCFKSLLRILIPMIYGLIIIFDGFKIKKTGYNII